MLRFATSKSIQPFGAVVESNGYRRPPTRKQKEMPGGGTTAWNQKTPRRTANPRLDPTRFPPITGKPEVSFHSFTMRPFPYLRAQRPRPDHSSAPRPQTRSPRLGFPNSPPSETRVTVIQLVSQWSSYTHTPTHAPSSMDFFFFPSDNTALVLSSLSSRMLRRNDDRLPKENKAELLSCVVSLTRPVVRKGSGLRL